MGRVRRLSELLGTAEPLCSSNHQPNRLARNSFRAAEAAVRLMRADGLFHGPGLELTQGAAEPAHPVTAAAFRAVGRSQAAVGRLRVGDIGRDPGFLAAVRTHLNELLTHAPATRHHLGNTTRDTALWSYGLGAAAPAVHAFLLLRRSAPDDPGVVQGPFVLASLVFAAALIAITAQAGNTWHPLEDPQVPAAIKELALSRADARDGSDTSRFPGDPEAGRGA
ncbi:hypothetical protein [Streptomyces sp. H34-S4]|uniref:hypothetical protein n=1 Tax=Streptomyces sp. H34-S4 TaxID=2996463 RepID=UPI00226F5145|nr:hypothetical protein [Streptomyces sp. H34-S4]MCY0937269.1 hypothetical protein [Streptomyces sp. H34-S4]